MSEICCSRELPHWWHLRCASRILRQGGVVAYPTEAVFGLGCDPSNRAAVEHLLRIKGRPPSKGLVLIAGHYSQLEPYLLPLSPSAMRTVFARWPGATTWLLPARSGIPYWLTGGGAKLAVRVTAHALAAALCDWSGGALVSTSANRTGLPPARDALAVRKHFGVSLDYILPGCVGGAERPSEIIDAQTGKVLRAS
jgi:L-threonylcarbamoyladenylate synthase